MTILQVSVWHLGEDKQRCRFGSDPGTGLDFEYRVRKTITSIYEN